MASINKRVAKALQEEFIEGTIYRIDLDRVDVAPAGSPGILHSLPLTGDRDKVKPGDPVKVINVGGERVALVGDMALDEEEDQTSELPERWRAEVAEMVGNRAEEKSTETDINLGDLNNVDTSSTPPANGDALVWDDGIQQWVPRAGGGTNALTLQGYMPAASGASAHVLLTDTSGGATISGNAAIAGNLTVSGWVSDGYEELGWRRFRTTAQYYAADCFMLLNGNYTGYIVKGSKVRFYQSGWRYGYVRTSTYSGGHTYVYVIPGIYYFVINAAISSAWFSVANPPDFPAWHNYTPVRSGATLNAIDTAMYAISGGMLFLCITASNRAVSGAGTMNIKLPVAITSSGIYTFDVNVIDASLGYWRKVRCDTGGQDLVIMKTANYATWTGTETGIYLEVRGSTQL